MEAWIMQACRRASQRIADVCFDSTLRYKSAPLIIRVLKTVMIYIIRMSRGPLFRGPFIISLYVIT